MRDGFWNDLQDVKRIERLPSKENEKLRRAWRKLRDSVDPDYEIPDPELAHQILENSSYWRVPDMPLPSDADWVSVQMMHRRRRSDEHSVPPPTPHPHAQSTTEERVRAQMELLLQYPSSPPEQQQILQLQQQYERPTGLYKTHGSPHMIQPSMHNHQRHHQRPSTWLDPFNFNPHHHQ